MDALAIPKDAVRPCLLLPCCSYFLPDPLWTHFDVEILFKATSHRFEWTDLGAVDLSVSYWIPSPTHEELLGGETRRLHSLDYIACMILFSSLSHSRFVPGAFFFHRYILGRGSCFKLAFVSRVEPMILKRGFGLRIDWNWIVWVQGVSFWRENSRCIRRVCLSD